MARLSGRIPDDLHEWFTQTAARRGRTNLTLYQDALECYRKCTDARDRGETVILTITDSDGNAREVQFL